MIKNLLIVSNKPLLRIRNITSIYSGREGYKIFEAFDADTAINESKPLERLVVVFFINQFSVLNDIIEIAGHFYDELESQKVKIIVISYIKHATLKLTLNKIGVDYIFSSSAQLPVIEKAINVCFSEIEKHIESQEKIKQIVKNLAIPQATAQIACEGIMETPFDYFLHEGKSSFKRVMGRWHFNLIGPSLNLGTWIKTRREPYKGKNVWEFIFHNKANELFHEQDGTWIFEGLRPYFKDHKWFFESEKPLLIFVNEFGEEKKVTTRIAGTFLVFKNNSSSVALNLEKIKKSLDLSENENKVLYKNLLFKNEDEAILVSSVENNEVFEIIKSRELRKSYIDESIYEKKMMTIWTSGKEIISHAQIDNLNKEDEYSIRWSKSENNKKILKEIANGKHQTIYSKIDLPRGLIFFPIYSPTLLNNHQEVAVKLPEKMWRVQRREYFRLEYTKESNVPFCQIAFGKSRFKVQIANMSAGGLAVYCEKLDEDLYLNREISEVLMKINGQQYKTRARIKWCRLNKKSQRLAMGLEFLDFSKGIKMLLDNYVLENTYVYRQSYQI